MLQKQFTVSREIATCTFNHNSLRTVNIVSWVRRKPAEDMLSHIKQYLFVLRSYLYLQSIV